jgi:hypothetical protein
VTHEWSIHCDRVGCTAHVTVACETDAMARDAVQDVARREGWLLRDRDENAVTSINDKDLCPRHARALAALEGAS